jgi:hypothetical protein
VFKSAAYIEFNFGEEGKEFTACCEKMFRTVKRISVSVDLDEPHAKCVLTYVYTNIAIRFG